MKVFTPQKLLLMTDYDGTLVPFQPRPELAVPDGQLLSLLEQLLACRNLVIAIISGRDLAQLKEFFPLSGLALVGGHGAQLRWPDGIEELLINPVELRGVKERLLDLARRELPEKAGFWLEEKNTGLAIHYRQVEPALAKEKLQIFRRQVLALLPPSWEMLSGKLVLELKPAFINKGLAVRRLCQRWPEYWPIYLGDDITDESAFQELKQRGTNFLVSPEHRPTAAGRRLRDYQQVRQFLQRLTNASTGGRLISKATGGDRDAKTDPDLNQCP